MKPTLYILVCFILTSCLNSESAVPRSLEDEFNADFPVANMNKSFQLKVDGDTSIFQKDLEIPVVFNNTSPNTISFQTELFLKLLIIKDNKWIEIKNQYSYSGPLQIAPQGTLLLDNSTATVQPELDDDLISTNKNHLVLMRILMIGEILDKDLHTGRFVGAYIDVFLKPENGNLGKKFNQEAKDEYLAQRIFSVSESVVE